MGPRAPSFSGLLRHPVTHASILERDGSLSTPDGRPVPEIDGFPNLLPARKPFRHRFWAWVYNLTAFGYDFGVRAGWRLALGGAPIDRYAFLSRLDVRPGMRVLETAVGSGENLIALPPGPDYYGFDQSVAMLRRCRSKLGRAGRCAGLVLADMSSAPFLDGMFDLVFHLGGLQFLVDPRRGVEEMYRVTRPGGRGVIADEKASAAAMVRRSGAGDLRGLVPVKAEDVHIETISGGELIAIEFRKNL